MLVLPVLPHAGGLKSPASPAQTGPQTDGGSTEALEALSQRLRPITSFEADFTQTVTSADGYIVQEMTGHMMAARPGKIFWESDPPLVQQVISDGKTLWLYDPDLDQVTVRPFENDVSRTPAVVFIGGADSLGDQYRVSVEQADNSTRFWLEPRSPSDLYEKIAIDFEGEQPVAMALWDSLGQVTRVVFSAMTLNGALQGNPFTFTPPDGVDVLYDGQ
ncbi:MAG: outer membrane lipoprotein carrier protein LolA [Porticoccaceae bacterium]|nr:outer membrane lipoprotein carrier protein LolA [Porticoccaceae bacterium]